MNINIKATNIELTDSIRQHVTKCLESISKVLDVSDDQLIGQIEVGKISNHHKSGDIFKAEANLRAKGRPLYAVAEKSDLHMAIDEMRDEIISEAKKVKSKKLSLLRRGGHKAKNFIKGFFNKE